MNPEVVTSLRADQIAAKARECFELGLIREDTLNRVVEKAYSDPEYNPILDLPFDHVLRDEREARAQLERQSGRTRRLLWWRRLLFWKPRPGLPE
jgi:hypothetical protein